MVGRHTVPFGDERGIGIERVPRLTVAKPSCDGSNVDTGREHPCGGEVTQVVQPRGGKTFPAGDTTERAGGLVGPVRRGAVGRFGQDERARRERRAMGSKSYNSTFTSKRCVWARLQPYRDSGDAGTCTFWENGQQP